MLVPEPVRPGDRVAVVAPSSPFGREEYLRGLAWLRARYELVVSGGIFSRDGYLAGTDDRRASELTAAMLRPDVKAIVAARGGYGATRMASGLPWADFARAPKWLVGFSDVTALHCLASAHGVRSVHGPHVTGLGWASPLDRTRFMRSFEKPFDSFQWTKLTRLRPGTARGVAFGGNLTMLFTMAASGALRVPRGAVVMLEDVTERPYRVDRMLTALSEGGYFSGASALVFGGFTQCDPGGDGVSVERVLAERASGLTIPVAAGAPFGHGERNEAFALGREVLLEGDVLTFV